MDDTGGPVNANGEEASVGATLRRLRKAKGMSLQALADESGVSVGMISQVERGLANPSIKLLTSLRRALNISMQELFGESDPDHPAPTPNSPDPGFVRRRENRPTIDLGMIHKELLTTTDRQNLQIMILNIEPGGESGGRALSYPAEKGGMVLEGEAVLRVDEQDALLRTGDSFVFDSARPHSIRNLGSVTARILWIIGAVQFDRHL
ncbi:helix-turn-helix domain-containing protein [Maritimibacter alkaliphilus]|uniref:helix-turn-helix domain-containing protein n=1 Tax=Maritimibacter alkaliphilus TaxID=404236 RepID=UPI001C94E3C1|nr:helix-turn-helix domain-containing protein [Maritimibacter alkaliphilus]MBY6092201.1 helix-turn-helix domain-containing protein [Maritimibacter alkaliphilus]